MKQIILKLTTHVSAGTASTTSDIVVCGKLYAVYYIPGTIDTGATLTITANDYLSNSKPLFTKASAGTAVSWYYPRDLVHAAADGSALTGTAGGDRACPVIGGSVTAAIASGGNSKVGYCIIYYED